MGLPSLLCAFVVGIALAPSLSPHLAWSAAPLVSAGLWLGLRRHRSAPLLLLTFVLLLGIALCQLQRLPPTATNDISRLIDPTTTVIITARVDAIEQRPGTGATFIVEALQVERDGTRQETGGRLRLSVREGRSNMRPGDTILFRTRLYAPSTFQTPGEFDAPRHLASLGIFTTGAVPNMDEITLLDAPAGRFQLWLQHRRSAVGRFIDDQLDPLTAPLVKALTIGTQSDIDPQIRRRLTNGGVWHLFSISGSHLAIIAGLLLLAGTAGWRRFEALLLFFPPGRIVPLLALPLLYGFYLWTGAGVATLRALLMFALIAMLFGSARHTTPWNVLVLVAGAILLLSPLTLFEPAFQLSVAGVAGIVLLVPRLTPRLRTLPWTLHWLSILLLTTIAATLATLPLVLLHFRLLTPAGLLTNLLAVPLVGVVIVPLTLLASFLTALAPAIASLLFHLCAYLLLWLLRLIDAVTSWPLLAGRIVYLTPLEIVAVALAVAALLLPWQSRWRPTQIALALVATLLLALPSIRPPAPSLIVLSVGQGEALLLTLSNGAHYLVDGGGLYGTSFDTGERLLAPALARLGVKRLAGVIMTHPHPDHSQGLAYILATMPVAGFWQAAGEELPEPLGQILSERAIPIHAAPPGWSELPCDGRDRLELFHPRAEQATANDHSLVLLATLGSDKLLLPADIETAGVEELVASTPKFATVLLKLPHHGSRHSAPDKLLDHFPPALAVVSVGRDNRFGFPHEATLTALQQRSVPLWRTDRDGTLRMRPQERGWVVEHWNNGDFH